MFEGVFPILPTPFHDDESLDLDSYARIVSFAVDVGVTGITILGVLGEANRLVGSEREQLIETAIRAADGRIPVVVGTSHSGSAAALALSRQAASLGAQGVMVTPQREPVPNPQRIFEYFSTVAEAGLPIVLQDHPVSTQVHMGIDLVLRIVEENDTVACIKQEALPSPPRVAALTAGMKKRRVPILTGLGALYGGYELLRGANGFMTGFAFPEVLLALVAAARSDDQVAVMDLYARYLPLIVFEQQPGVAVRKDVFRMRGLMTSSKVRHPGASIDPGTRRQLEAALSYVLPGVDITRPLEL